MDMLRHGFITAGVTAAGMICLVSLLAPTCSGLTGMTRTISTETPADVAHSTTFGVSLSNLSDFSIALGFTANVSLSQGSVNPGEHTTATAGLQAPSTASLDIGYLGTPVALPIKPLGNVYEVPIPGLSYGYEGIAELGLYLNLSAVVTGNLTLSGAGIHDVLPVTWNASMSFSLPLNITANATPGTVINWTLTNLTYGLSIGIDAIGSVLSASVTVPLINFGSVGLVAGDPPAFNASYSVASPGSSSPSGFASFINSNPAGFVGILIVLGAGVGVAVLLLYRKRKGKSSAKSGPEGRA